MKLLIFWDIFGRVWRKALEKELPILRKKYNPDFVVANIENATSWRWPIEKHAVELENLWIDIMTSWDHIFDNEEKISSFLWDKNSILLRPANLYESEFYKFPWKWYVVLEKNNKKILIINLLSETFMRYNVYNPFLKADEILKSIDISELDWIVIDFHKEVSSEWFWLGYFLEWRASFIYGTHTHSQTNDEVILENGTWIIGDVWMVWPFPSVIWASFESLKKRFLTWVSKWKIEQSLVDTYVVNWVFVEIENKKCINIEKIRIRNKL